MSDPYLEPAATVVTICGGIDATARLVNRDRTVVNRWLLSKERGGTGGLVPMRHARVLLAKVPKLKQRHFFAPASPAAPPPAEERAA